MLSNEEVREIYDVRAMLEGAIVRRLAAGTGGPYELLYRCEGCHPHRRSWPAIRPGRRVPRAAGGLCHNEQLMKMLRGVLNRATMHFSLAAPQTLCAGPHDHGATSRPKGNPGARWSAKQHWLMLDHLMGLVEMQGCLGAAAKRRRWKGVLAHAKNKTAGFRPAVARSIGPKAGCPGD